MVGGTKTPGWSATKDEFLVKRCLNHTNPSVTAIYVRISQEEVARAIQAQADPFFALMAGPVVLPALTQDLTVTQ
jgi:hypothetical protein